MIESVEQRLHEAEVQVDTLSYENQHSDNALNRSRGVNGELVAQVCQLQRDSCAVKIQASRPIRNSKQGITWGSRYGRSIA